MQWLILTEGLPVGAWRERIGLPSECPLCPERTRETLAHAFKDCPEVCRAWSLLSDTRAAAGLPPAFITWTQISRGLMTIPEGLSAEEELRWDTAAAFSINSNTPWDILRAQLLWAIWCQRVAHAFSDESFHLGVVLWNAWRNTIYCAMEAYKELFRHKRNEEKRQEMITCFQQIWTSNNVFGRLQGDKIRWNLTPHLAFLPKELSAWTAAPIRINRLSPTPDLEADFVARPDFANLVQDFLQGIGNNWRPPSRAPSVEAVRSQQSPMRPAVSSPEGPNLGNGPLTSQPATHIGEGSGTQSQGKRTPSRALTLTNKEGEENRNPNIRPTSRPKKCCNRRKHQRKEKPRESPTPPSRPALQQRPSEHTQQAPSNRRKMKCTFGPNSHQRVNTISLLTETSHAATNERQEVDEDGLELDELLREIDRFRHQPSSPHNDSNLAQGEEGNTSYQAPPKSRQKAKCFFGPQSKKTTRETPLLDIITSTPQHTRTTPAAHLSNINLGGPITEIGQSSNSNSVIPTRAYPWPDRVTLAPPGLSYAHSPLEKYKDTVEREPQSHPYRFTARRLGMTIDEFEAAIAKEVDETLHEFEVERRLAKGPMVLDKEYWRDYFRDKEFPTTGQMLGIYQWAHDLGISRFNFETFSFDLESILLLNAYD